MLWTAMRPGEALALRWEDIDLDVPLLTVRATLAQDLEGRVYRSAFTKGKASRLVPLVPLRSRRGRHRDWCH
jgi:integrase